MICAGGRLAASKSLAMIGAGSSEASGRAPTWAQGARGLEFRGHRKTNNGREPTMKMSREMDEIALAVGIGFALEIGIAIGIEMRIGTEDPRSESQSQSRLAAELLVATVGRSRGRGARLELKGAPLQQLETRMPNEERARLVKREPVFSCYVSGRRRPHGSRKQRAPEQTGDSSLVAHSARELPSFCARQRAPARRAAVEWRRSFSQRSTLAGAQEPSCQSAAAIERLRPNQLGSEMATPTRVQR